MEGNHSFLSYCFGAVLIAAVAFTVSYRSAHVTMLLHNLSTPRSGEVEVLPPEAVSVLDCVRQSGAKSVQLSKLLADNRFLAQPITESIYPALVTDQGQLYVSYLSEPLPAGCVSLKEAKRVRIAACR
ncbi:hypothetical protein KP004_07880 [Geomonas oryzisoli]|uniref:Uncharacterized protein n=2 Tax=Geomonas oryzisoli TaxID=2847992 RepID=A0ABX8JG88_9BACT|nr:hypothetical protein KP004_07880 [Geomonas oryzisoli]